MVERERVDLDQTVGKGTGGTDFLDNGQS